MTKQLNDSYFSAYQRMQMTGDEDIVLFEGTNDLPLFDFPYMVDHVVISFCMAGYIKGYYNMQEVTVSKGDFTVLLPGQLVSCCEVSPDYRSMMVLMTVDYAMKLRRQGSLKVQLASINRFVIPLSDDEVQVMHHCYDVMRYLISNNVKEKNEALNTIFYLMSQLLNNFENFKNYTVEKVSHQEHVFERFYNLLVKHYRESRKAIWYADKLCITPKYLSTIIKKTTSRSAVDWINDFVALKAKSLLIVRKQMTIAEIADYLGFEDQAIFSKFFKKQTGKTPTAYRKG